MHCQSAIVFKLDAFKMNVHIKKEWKRTFYWNFKRFRRNILLWSNFGYGILKLKSTTYW